MAWSNIIGQERVKGLLQRTFESGRIPHAFLFHGPDGVGKDATAIEFSKLLNCHNPSASGACDLCLNCHRIKKFQHPNLKFVFPLPRGKSESEWDDPLKGLSESVVEEYKKGLLEKGKDPYIKIELPRANSIKINSIREIQRFLTLTRPEAGKKIVIISDADKMNVKSANSVLKTLEEPAPHSIIILTTSLKDSLLPTILSRCQHIRFDPLTENEIFNGLKTVYNGNEEAQLDIAAKLANGNFRKGKNFLEADLLQMRDYAVDFLRLILARPPSIWIKELETITRKSEKNDIIQFLQILNLWLRDALVVMNGIKDDLVNVDQLDILEKFVMRFEHADLPRAINSIEKSIALVGKNVYIFLVLINLVFDLRYTINVKSKRTEVLS